jgi:uncharacterized protein (TIGR00288 family)
MAVFCDFENVALGVRDAKYDRFDIGRVLERLLLKGPIVVKKAYCDWGRYAQYKATMHEAAFELIDIPHVRQSGKNSADIRMVVDALDLCYTKSHVTTFVLITGDSDFSPLVSKLRENDKQAIGVGVKKSTSDLLIANCDEFIYYDDLVREQPEPRSKAKAKAPARTRAKQGEAADDKQSAKPGEKQAGKPAGKVAAKQSTTEEANALVERQQQAIDLVLETVDELIAERGADGKIWGSMVKQAIKRRKPGFSESYYGFRSFARLLEEAAARDGLELEEDEKSGGVIIRGYKPGF